MSRAPVLRRSLTGWGRASPSMANLVLASGEVDVRLAVRDAGTRGVLARGLGRSYGDSAQNGGGTVVDMTGLARILSVDTTTGHVVTEAGVSLDTLVRVLLSLGLLVPVLPGTRQVTVGGASPPTFMARTTTSRAASAITWPQWTYCWPTAACER
jgi:decaprenylphospho-beta-D-ribofuranose 2-oxidase